VLNAPSSSSVVQDGSGSGPAYGGKSIDATIIIATLVGVGMNFTPINPIKALYWSAVINGVVAVP